MRAQTAIFFFVGIMFVLGLLFIVILTDSVDKGHASTYNTSLNSQYCRELGCNTLDANTTFLYIASKNSNAYYDCSCLVYAKQVRAKERICFTSKEEAAAKNYKKVSCP